MTGQHFAQLVAIEIRKMFTRTVARAGLVLALVIGGGVPALRGLAYLFQTRIAGATAEIVVVPAEIVGHTLWVRNFVLMHILLVTLTALVFAGEYQTRTLREDLVRPVPRWSVLMAKWLALCAWIVTTVVLSFLPAAGLSMAAWGLGGDWGQVALGYLATIAADTGFAAVLLLGAVIIRGVPGTIAAMMMFYFVDIMVWAGLQAATFGWVGMLFGLDPATQELAKEAAKWVPFSGFVVWTGFVEQLPWSAPGFAVLGGLTVGSLAAANWLFARLDVP